MKSIRLPILLSAVLALLPAPCRAESLEELKAREAKVQATVQKVMPTVICISSADPKKQGSGSGVIVQKDGLILTAAHVTAATGDDIVITFPDGKKVKGKALGGNKGTDAAMAKIVEEGEWPHAEIGNSDRMKRGEWCIAMGHPGGFSYERRPPVRTGRIWQRDLDGAIRSSCPLIGGDSGGPLFDLDGRVIGINSSIHGAVDQNRHVAVDTLREDWDRLIKGESWGDQSYGAPASRPTLGAEFDPDSQDGVKVEKVWDDAPAAKAGLQGGDVITKFDGADVATFHHLCRIVNKKKSGDKIKIAYRRGGDNKEGEMELGSPARRRGPLENGDGQERAPEKKKPKEEPKDDEAEGEGGDAPPEPKIPDEPADRAWLGAELEDTSGKGARVTGVKENSPAAKAGLSNGDMILKLNDKDVDGPTPASELLRSLKPGDKITIKGKRGETDLSVEATLEKKS
jgi:serine protease Do